MPASLDGLELTQLVMVERNARPRLVRLPKRLRDRVTRAIAHLQESLARRAAAARQAVGGALPRELHAELLQPVDRVLSVSGERRHELGVRGLVRGAHHVLGVLLG